MSREEIKTPDEIAELIHRRRRQILVHSVLYYKMSENIISDAQWTIWAVELEELQRDYPQIAANVPMAEEFEDFDHSTGMNLPLTHPLAINKARQLLQYHKKYKENK